MSELAFREIDAPVKTSVAVAAAASGGIDLKKINITDVALAQFGDWRADLKAAEARLKDVAWDVSTAKGLKDITSVRHQVTKVPQANANNTADALVTKLTAVNKEVRAEQLLIVNSYKKLGEPLTAIIDARQAEIEEAERIAEMARQETARIEAARVADHQAFIAAIRAYLTHCQKPGMTAERIGNGVTALGAVTVGPEREEFEAPALAAKVETLQAMQDLHAAAVASEAHAAKVEAQRVENERKAAELAQQAADIQAAKDAAQAVIDEAARLKLLADAAALLERQRAEQAAQPQTDTDTTQQAPQQVLKAEAVQPDATDRGTPATASPVGGPVGVGQPAAAGPADGAADAPAATLKLGELQARMAPFSITADGLAQLGFARQPRPGPGVHFLASEWPAIRAAAVKHFQALA